MKEIIFVYNADADSSFFSAANDFAKKLTGSESYPCNLCKITYGLFGMKGEWKEFLDTLAYKKSFLHRDEFIGKYPNLKNILLPAVFIKEGDNIRIIVSAEEINRQGNIRELKSLLEQKLGLG